jgi:hypothetical protein
MILAALAIACAYYAGKYRGRLAGFGAGLALGLAIAACGGYFGTPGHFARPGASSRVVR